MPLPSLPPTQARQQLPQAVAQTALLTFIIGWAVHSRQANTQRFDGRQCWDKDILLFKQWCSCCQPLPAIATLDNGWLLRPLLSRSSSATTSS
jgi:hypothetical protein